MRTWQLQEAKARLSELVKKSAAEGPQRITLRGEPAAVLISSEEYQRLSRPRQGFVDFMRHSPLCEVKLNLGREQTPARKVDIE
ncbi:MAG: type II toxin-antitoxin system Phd/YefM family antitoxin [Thermoleophilia bacterium]